MAKVNLLTQAEYAKHRDCSAVAVHKAVKAGRISLIDGKIDPEVADIQWAQNSRARAGTAVPAGGAGPAEFGGGSDEAKVGDNDYMKARTRREEAEATIAELKRGELAGELIRVAAVRTVMAQSYATTREAILNLPARLAPKLAVETDPASIQNILHAELHEALTQLASSPLKARTSLSTDGEASGS